MEKLDRDLNSIKFYLVVHFFDRSLTNTKKRLYLCWKVCARTHTHTHKYESHPRVQGKVHTVLVFYVVITFCKTYIWKI